MGFSLVEQSASRKSFLENTDLSLALPAAQELIQELAAKEQEKRAALMAQLGLKPGQKITIQPRRDG